MVHQDAAHHASAHREEVRAVLPRDVRVDEPEIRLVDERCGLQTVTRALARHAAPCDLVKFPMDEWNQPIEGSLIALPLFEKQPGDLRRMSRNAIILDLFSSRAGTKATRGIPKATAE